MTEAVAKEHLREMLRFFTPGSVLHLLSELYREAADQAHRDHDHRTEEQCRNVEAALFVFGLGVDAARSGPLKEINP